MGGGLTASIGPEEWRNTTLEPHIAGLTYKGGGIVEIPCKVIEDETPEELSLAANFERLAMHPMDEHEAFARLYGTDAKLTEQMIANRFGIPVARVRRRLALGRLCDEARKAYREGTANDDLIQALTRVDDHAVQRRILRAAKESKAFSAWAVREAIDQQQRTVGRQLFNIEDYKAAGGAIIEDLFAQPGEPAEYFADVKLYNELQAGVIAKRMDELRGDGWGAVVWSDDSWNMPKGVRLVGGTVESTAKKNRPRLTLVLGDNRDGSLRINIGQSKEQERAAAKAGKSKAKENAKTAIESPAGAPVER